MGANHPGEIKYLTAIAKPDVALINNAAPAHLEGFGSLQGVAQAKGEIYSGLSEQGVAIINADDDFYSYWQGLNTEHRTITFGLHNKADVSAEWESLSEGSHITLKTPIGAMQFILGLPGQHNVMNALAATACAIAVDISLETIKQGLETIRPVAGRLQLKQGIHDSHIIDDTYNANPASLKVALDVLLSFQGEHFLALGDMGELGEDARTIHSAAGVEAREMGVNKLYTLGELSRLAATSFGEDAKSFDEYTALVEALKKDLHTDVTLLVKGSRRMQMDKVVDALTPGREA